LKLDEALKGDSDQDDEVARISGITRPEFPEPTARKLGQSDRGQMGLWVGNNSDGDFTNLRVTLVK
jgi:hypothetical protein